MKKDIKLTFIIPAYNEEKIIGETLKSILSFLSPKTYTWEVIVVDDGSKDKTSTIVKSFKKQRVRLISFAENKGKGAAIRAGVKKSRGEFIIFSDADLSVPIENIDKLLLELTKSDVAIGSRRIKGSKILVHQSWLRESMGRVFTFLTRLILGSEISDFTCGFKGFRREAALDIFGKARLDRWAYDAEILFLAQKRGDKIAEIPIFWKNREDTRVALGNAALVSFVDLLKIRFNDILGKYGKNKKIFKD